MAIQNSYNPNPTTVDSLLRQRQMQADLAREQGLIPDCGASPSAMNTTVYHFNYLNISILIALILVAILLIRKNRDAVANILNALREHYLPTLFMLLVAAILVSVLIGDKEDYQKSKLINTISRQFYTTSIANTPEYEDYLACRQRVNSYLDNFYEPE